MIFLRLGTRILFVRSTNPKVTNDRLVENFGYENVSLIDGQNDSDEHTTLIFITKTGLNVTDPDDAEFILLAKASGTYVLSDIINQKTYTEIDQIDLGPRMIVFRVPGNENEFAEILRRDFNGQRVTWKDGVRMGEKEDTIISLTKERLHQTIKTEDFYFDHVLVNQDQKECFARLGREALFYITHGLKESSWYEYKISLYDAYENYEQHYQRLVQVFSGLEMGLLLGEGWTKDYAHIIMSIMVYQIRLFSLAPPEEIKKILIGLEYDAHGNRLADFDLYHKNKKVSWTEVQKNSKDKKGKLEEGMNLRAQLMGRLPEKEKRTVLELDSVILSSRNH